ncbi:FCD domain-containing protein [Streptomyces sp. HD1123-B1]|uniref:FadR/GntR family transcriptional regulator n=1 Tax=Streptomyces huangiella TaxID=3228804 RepID=UPI003D7DC322
MSLADTAIAHIRELIRSGELPPGARLPPGQRLATEWGLAPDATREAVEALTVTRVLEVRPGGTYVSSREPRLLLAGLGVAGDLLRDDTLLELCEVRRLLEPPVTALAATRISEAQLDEVGRHLDAMCEARDHAEELSRHDVAFHRAVAAATGNQTLTVLLEGISGRTLGARVWRGLVDDGAADRTLSEHQAIYTALAARDAPLAEAAALMHVSDIERWLHNCRTRTRQSRHFPHMPASSIERQ